MPTAPTAPTAPTPGEYLGADHAADPELRRLRQLQAVADPFTWQALDAIGIERGSRVADVGAGAGSVAAELRRRVGPLGSVVAADIDPRFLDHLAAQRVEVRQHDIRSAPLLPGGFDVVTCRALLEHLPDPVAAVRNLAAGLDDGGTLLLEVADASTFGLPVDDPAQTGVQQVVAAVLGGLRAAGMMNLYLGRGAVAVAESAGLVVDDVRLIGAPVRGGDDTTSFWADTLAMVAPKVVGLGLVEEGALSSAIAQLRDPEFRCLGMLIAQVHARVT